MPTTSRSLSWQESRQITEYEDIPPIVRDAILAAEDKNFFSHSGVDYSIIPRVLGKVRIGPLVARLARTGTAGRGQWSGDFPARRIDDHPTARARSFSQNLTDLQNKTAQENRDHLRQGALLPRVLFYVIGARNALMLVRKIEEIRLSLWVEEEMQERFGSKRRAKEEILARYASFIYMGNSQYGFAAAAEYYFDRPLATFTADDADKAALLAGIAKSPRYYAPSAKETGRVLRRRDQTLGLMAANGFISRDTSEGSRAAPDPGGPRDTRSKMLQAVAVVEHVFEELKGRGADLGPEDLP